MQRIKKVYISPKGQRSLTLGARLLKAAQLAEGYLLIDAQTGCITITRAPLVMPEPVHGT